MRKAEFHALYTRYADDIYRFAFWLAGDMGDAEDLTSETFARAWVARDRIRVETVKTYLLAITRNAYLRLRKDVRSPVATTDTALPISASGEQRLLLQEELRQVWDDLSKLSQEDRSAFLLRALHELPYKEIARVMGISVSSAKVKVHRVRLRLAISRKRGEK